MTEFKEALKEDVINKDTGLTEQETYFIDVLFEQCNGNIKEAMKQSGYPKDASPTQLTKKLKVHIQEATKAYLAGRTAKAGIALVEVLDDPSAIGANTIIKAAKEILEKGGAVNTEEQKQEIIKNVFILPPKDYKLDDIGETE